MPTVNLTEQEWQQVLGVIAQAPWSVANPLLMKIGEQLRVQQPNQEEIPKPHLQYPPGARGEYQPGFKRGDSFGDISGPPSKVNG